MKTSRAIVFAMSLASWFCVFTTTEVTQRSLGNDSLNSNGGFQILPSAKLLIPQTSESFDESLSLAEYLSNGKRFSLSMEVFSRFYYDKNRVPYHMVCDVQTNEFFIRKIRPNESVRLFARGWNAPQISYDFRPGEQVLLPFGEVYLVDGFEQDAKGIYRTSLKHIPWETSGRIERPDLTSILVQLGTSEDFGPSVAYGNGRFSFREATEAEQKKAMTTTQIKARIGVPWQEFGEMAELPSVNFLSVGPRSIIPVLDVGYRVRRIVPHDKEKKTIGWVELDPQPVPLRTRLGKELENLGGKGDGKALPLVPVPEPRK